MPTQTIYHVAGMSSWACADAVAERLSNLDGVHDVHIDIVAGTALITSHAVLPRDRVRAAITEAGYAPAARSPEERRADGVPAGWVIGGLVLALLAGYALARSLSPAAPEAAEPQASPHPHGSSGGGLTGLAISEAGYTLVADETLFPGTGDRRLSFVIKDRWGEAVTQFATVHEKPLHLILVRRDLSGFQHLHPEMAADGTWTYTASLREPGLWRAYADFTIVRPTGAEVALTLGYDITVAGDYRPIPLAVSQPAGVTFAGTPRVDELTALDFRVESAATLDRYLGALGHLVVLRQADLGYVHAHAGAQSADGTVRFLLSVPSTGTYRLFFQYKMDGHVHTAEFTLVVG